VADLAASGAQLFAAVDTFGVFVSSDNSTSWKNVTGNLDTLFAHKVTSLGVSGQNVLAGKSPYGGVYKRPINEMVVPASPKLTSPKDSATGVPINTTLTWIGPPNALSYRVVVTTLTKQGTVKVVDRSGITAPSLDVSGLDYNTRYVWVANATNAVGTSPASGSQTFVTVPLALPAKVTLISPPTAKNIGKDSIRFIWNGSSPLVTSYEVELTGDSIKTSVVNDTTIVLKISAGLVNKGYSWRVRGENQSGFGPFSDSWTFQRLTTSIEPGTAVPQSFDLVGNFPNPFNPTTRITYSIGRVVAPSTSEGRASTDGAAGAGNELQMAGSGKVGATTTHHILLTIYDVLGREVAVLVNEAKQPGRYTVEFDGNGLASGVYFCRLTAGSFVQTKSMVLTR
jgi:hypothetical protein